MLCLQLTLLVVENPGRVDLRHELFVPGEMSSRVFDPFEDLLSPGQLLVLSPSQLQEVIRVHGLPYHGRRLFVAYGQVANP